MEAWEVALRVLVFFSLAAGAWTAWKRLPPPIRVRRKRYYRQPNGTFRTIWGRRARDPDLVTRLEAEPRVRNGEG
jgi:hypothetical protein